jgi:hypothetical protein
MATVATASRPSNAVQQRAAALAAQLQYLRAPVANGQPAAQILDELQLEPVIQAEISRYRSSADNGRSSIPELVAHACAFLAKYGGDMAALQPAGASEQNALYTAQAELMLDVAIGTALLRELQPAIDEAVRAGEISRAKIFSQLVHRVRSAVSSAEKIIGDAGRSDAAKLVEAMTDRPRDTQSSAAMDQVAREIGDDYERKERGAKQKREILQRVRWPSSTEMLALTLACSLVLLVAAVILPQAVRQTPATLTLEDLPGGVVTEVRCRPPSLYVSLDRAVWESADPMQRESILGEVTSVLLAEDAYRGAWITTNDGVPIAVWWRGTGVRLLEVVEPAVDSRARPKAQLFDPGQIAPTDRSW